jgi:hypothetical protein
MGRVQNLAGLQTTEEEALARLGTLDLERHTREGVPAGHNAQLGISAVPEAPSPSTWKRELKEADGVA